VRSVRDDCLSKVIPLGEQHLRGLLREYVAHYHLERNHQGLGNVLVEPSNDSMRKDRVLRRTRIGGALNFDDRALAQSAGRTLATYRLRRRVGSIGLRLPRRELLTRPLHAEPGAMQFRHRLDVPHALLTHETLCRRNKLSSLISRELSAQ
jgi:hypothetical protein